MNSILEEDIKNIADSKLVNWEEFNNKSILNNRSNWSYLFYYDKSFLQKEIKFKNVFISAKQRKCKANVWRK